MPLNVKSFSQASTAVLSMRQAGTGVRFGWKFICYNCNQERKYTFEYWDDAYGAAHKTMETHRCPQ